MTGFEPATSWSQTKRATSCATSRIYDSLLENGALIKRAQKTPAFFGLESKGYFIEATILSLRLSNTTAKAANRVLPTTINTTLTIPKTIFAPSQPKKSAATTSATKPSIQKKIIIYAPCTTCF